MIRSLIILSIASCTLATKLKTVYEWKYVDYEWECDEQKEKAISENRYDYTKIIINDVQKVPYGPVFVTTPARFANAIPASLSTVSYKKGPGGPLLRPYPNWGWHNSTNCTGITNVWRTTSDDCDRLWVVDSGEIALKQVCPAQLLVFDIKTDELLKRIIIPDDISHSPQNKTVTRLTHPVVETEGPQCERTWVYVANFMGGGIVIYGGTNLWRRDDDVFHPEPPTSVVNVAGQEVILNNGLTNFALTPGTLLSSDYRRLFFRGAASVQLHSVSVNDLHTPEMASKDICFTTSKYRFPSALTAQTFSKDGILFFGLSAEIAIGCWNSNTTLNAENVDIVAQDNETLQWVISLKITKCSDYSDKDEIWILSNRLQKALTLTLNFNETNFRIFTALVDDLVVGSKCESQSGSYGRESSSGESGESSDNGFLDLLL